MKQYIWFSLCFILVSCQRQPNFIEAETEINSPSAATTTEAEPQPDTDKPLPASSAATPLSRPLPMGPLAAIERQTNHAPNLPDDFGAEFEILRPTISAAPSPSRPEPLFPSLARNDPGRRLRMPIASAVFPTPSAFTGIVNESFVQGEVLQQFNLLFVIDNSESMADVREFVRTNLKRILEPLTTSRQQLDFRIAVTITDPAGRKPGFFRTKRGVPYIAGRSPLNPQSLSKIHQEWDEILSQIQPTRFRGWEQGLKASEESLQQDWASFMRVRSHLAVIWLTDEDDYSAQKGFNYPLPEGETGAAYPERHRHLWESVAIDHYLDFFKSVEASTQADVLLYPVIHSNTQKDALCREPELAGNDSVGTRYLDLVSRWPSGKAKALSICQDDLAKSFDEIADLTADRDICFDLSSPMTPTQVIVGARTVKESLTEGYSVKKTGSRYKLCFAPQAMPKPGEKISVTGLAN